MIRISATHTFVAAVLVLELILNFPGITITASNNGLKLTHRHNGDSLNQTGRSIASNSAEKTVRKRNSELDTITNTKKKHMLESKFHLKKDDGIQIKLARKKESKGPRDPVGTIVKIPNINHLSEFDSILIDILGESGSAFKPGQSSEKLEGRSGYKSEEGHFNDFEEEELTTSSTTTTTTTTTQTPPKPSLSSPEPFVYIAKSNGAGSTGFESTADKTGNVNTAIKLVQGKQPEVKSKSGVFYRGKILNINSKEVFAFYGIPYAVPPLDALRFKRPFPLGMIAPNTTFEMSKIRPSCFQTRQSPVTVSLKHQSSTMTSLSSEDCLYLNIWLPSALMTPGNLAPVLVWIHGGGFLSGLNSDDFQSAAAFVGETNILLISIQSFLPAQYRLGVFGFLHMGTDDAPGNMGLLDQIQALQWIDENIESFGGNPNAITIMGHDIGASFVGIHLISKISPSFFKRAVMLGGAPTQPHVFQSSYSAKQTGLNFAKEVGCVNSQSVKSIMECLRKVDTVTVWDLQLLFLSDPLTFPFVVTEDNYVIDDHPLSLLENGKGKVCQVMVGGTSNEGTHLFMRSVDGVSADKPTFFSFDKFLRIMSHTFRKYDELELAAILHQYKNWPNPEDGFSNQQKIIEALGDNFFTCPLRRFSDAWSGRGLNTYHFSFSQRSSAMNRSEWMGSVHGDEVDFFFGVPLQHPDKFTTEEVDLSKSIVKMLEEFIRTGIPSNNWDRYGYETPLYMELNTGMSDSTNHVRYGPRAQECGFWNDFFPKLESDIPAAVTTGRDHSSSSFNIDENCIVSLQNCSKSNLAIYATGR